MGGELATALVAFQKDMPTVTKGKRAVVQHKPEKGGGSHSYMYADLADVVAAAVPVLTAHGLAFTARPEPIDRGYQLVGVLTHVSGEEVTGSLPLWGNNPQDLGSSITYARRYLLGCLTGIVTDEDDDGKHASRETVTRTRREEPTVDPVAHARKGAWEVYSHRFADASKDGFMEKLQEYTGVLFEDADASTFRDFATKLQQEGMADE